MGVGFADGTDNLSAGGITMMAHHHQSYFETLVSTQDWFYLITSLHADINGNED